MSTPITSALRDRVSAADDRSERMFPSGPEPWWKGAVIYQVYPRSFRDTNGDGIGDLNGIIEGLDHIASLGVDAVWLSPFFTSPMDDFGYDIADYRGVDPMFGTLQDFDRLLEKAHGLGLKIIIDQVYSHTSDQHDWFAESRQSRTGPKADWYVWADPKPDGSPPSNWQSVFGGPAWEWDARRGQYYLHNFLRSQPDLNVHNPEVQQALLDVAAFWLDRGVDGFRLDALNFSMHDRLLRDNPSSGVPASEATRPFDMQRHVHNMSQPEVPAWLERIRALMDTYPGRFSVAEIGGPDPIGEMKAFTEGDARLDSAYSFDFLYAPELKPERVRASLGQWSGRDGEGWPSWAFSNHDAPRAVSRWASDDQRERAARTHLLVLLTLRGNAFIYQGEELGLPQAEVAFEDLKDPEAIANWPKTLGRDGARTPMPWTPERPHGGFSSGKPWLPVALEHLPLAVAAQDDAGDSMLNFTRNILALRRDLAPLRWGEVQFLAAPEGVLAFDRQHHGETVRVVVNLGEAPADIAPLTMRGWRILADGSGPRADRPAAPASLAPLQGFWAVRA